MTESDSDTDFDPNDFQPSGLSQSSGSSMNKKSAAAIRKDRGQSVQVSTREEKALERDKQKISYMIVPKEMNHTSKLLWHVYTDKKTRRVLPCRLCHKDEAIGLALQKKWDEKKKVLVEYIGYQQKSQRSVVNKNQVKPYGVGETFDPEYLKEYLTSLTTNQRLEELLLHRYLEEALEREGAEASKDVDPEPSDDDDDVDISEPVYTSPTIQPSTTAGGYKEETLKAGDEVEYTSPIFVCGDARGYRKTIVMEIRPRENPILKLQNAEILLNSTMIRRVRIMKRGKLVENPAGVSRPVDSYKLRTDKIEGADNVVQDRLARESRALGQIVDKLAKKISETTKDAGYGELEEDFLLGSKRKQQASKSTRVAKACLEARTDDCLKNTKQKEATKKYNLKSTDDSIPLWKSNLLKQIESIHVNKTKRRSSPPHMTEEQIELAIQAMENLQKLSMSIDDLAKLLKADVRVLDYFLKGDTDARVRIQYHNEMQILLEKWIGKDKALLIKETSKKAVATAKCRNDQDEGSPKSIIEMLKTKPVVVAPGKRVDSKHVEVIHPESAENHSSVAVLKNNRKGMAKTSTEGDLQLPKEVETNMIMVTSIEAEWKARLLELVENARNPKASHRGSPPYMSIKQLLLAIDIRQIMELSQISIDNLANHIVVATRNLEYFLSGDESKKVSATQHRVIQEKLEKWKASKSIMELEKPAQESKREISQVTANIPEWKLHLLRLLENNRIAKLKRRSAPPHMTEENLELAIKVREKMDIMGIDVGSLAMIIPTLPVRILEHFLKGDEGKQVFARQLQETHVLLAQWLTSESGRVNTPTDDISERFSRKRKFPEENKGHSENKSGDAQIEIENVAPVVDISMQSDKKKKSLQLEELKEKGDNGPISPGVQLPDFSNGKADAHRKKFEEASDTSKQEECSSDMTASPKIEKLNRTGDTEPSTTGVQPSDSSDGKMVIQYENIEVASEKCKDEERNSDLMVDSSSDSSSEAPLIDSKIDFESQLCGQLAICSTGETRMTKNQLELALCVHRRIVKINMTINALAEALDLPLIGLARFLEGDPDKVMGKESHKDTEICLAKWLDNEFSKKEITLRERKMTHIEIVSSGESL